MTKSCNEKNRKKSLYCIDKLYVQIGHELLRIEGIQMIFYYTNYETKVVNKPILWKNKDTVKYFDQFEIKKVNNIQEVKKIFFWIFKNFMFNSNCNFQDNNKFRNENQIRLLFIQLSLHNLGFSIRTVQIRV